MMSDDKKKKATLIISRLKEREMPSEAPVNELGDEMDDSIALDTAAEELLAAIDSKSPKALVEAMKSLLELMEPAEPKED